VIECRIAEESLATVELFDALGRRVLATGEEMVPAGRSIVVRSWDPPSGAYFCRLTCRRRGQATGAAVTERFAVRR
jgi:hypothetical protein